MKKIFNKEKIIKLFTNKKFIILFLLVIFSLIILSIFPCNLARLIFDVYFVIATLIFYFAHLFGVNYPLPLTPYDLFINNQPGSIGGGNGGEYYNDVIFRIRTYFTMIFTGSYAQEGLSSLVASGRIALLIITLLIFIWIIFIIFNSMYFDEGKSVKFGYTKNYLRIDSFFNRIKEDIKAFLNVFKGDLSYKFIKSIKLYLIFIILLNTGLLSLIIEVYCYLLILVSSFNLESIYWNIRSFQFYFAHLTTYIPLSALIVLIFVIYNLYRKRKAYKKLAKYDEKNKEFASKLGIIISVLGFPGAGKTTMAVSLMQDYEEMYREKAFSLMMKQRNKFLEFNWAEYNIYLSQIISQNLVYNRVQLRELLDKLLDDQVINNEVFNYKLSRKIQNYDGLIISKLKEALLIYAEAYFYYSSDKPRCYANSSILFKYRKVNNNNNSMPQFVYRYFDDETKLDNEDYHRSSLLYMDFMSLGMKINKNYGCIDSGIIFFTEKDKEFGNKNTNAGESRKEEDKVNVYNRLTDVYLMLSRHLHTIDSQPFFRYINDYQRSGTVGVDYAGITESTINIDSSNKGKILYSNWIIGRALYEFFITSLENFFIKSALNREVHNVFEWILIKVYNILARIYYYRINSFSITVKNIAVAGHENDMPNNYYFLWKKIYAGVFKTDCFKEFFSHMYEDKARVFDSEEVPGDYITEDQYKKLGSLFIDKLENYDGLKTMAELEKIEANRKKIKNLKKSKKEKNNEDLQGKNEKKLNKKKKEAKK